MPTQYYPTLNPWQQLAAIGSAIGRNVTGAMYDQPQQRFQNAMTLQQMADRQALQQHQMAMQDAQLGLGNNADKRAEFMAQLTAASQRSQQAQAENQLRLSQMAERGARAQTFAPAGLPEPQAIPGVSAMPLSQMGPMLGQFSPQPPMMTEGPSRASLYRQLEPQADIRGAQAGENANTFGALQQRDELLAQRNQFESARLENSAEYNNERLALEREKVDLQEAIKNLRADQSKSKEKKDLQESYLKQIMDINDLLSTGSWSKSEKADLEAQKQEAMRLWRESQATSQSKGEAVFGAPMKTPGGRTIRILGQ